MRNRKFKFYAPGALHGIATSVFAQDTTYVWQSADGDPFNIQATIVLDSPASVNGSASDVVSLYIADTVDTYSWNPENTSLWLGTTFCVEPKPDTANGYTAPGGAAIRTCTVRGTSRLWSDCRLFSAAGFSPG